MPTWTPDALASEARRLAGRCWRVVEGQHVVSTMKLVDTLEEQAVLERLLEGSKPLVPAECQHLHYLLATPFRYGAPYPRGSRFRRAGLSPGVFYASRGVRTAIAEMAFHRLLFFAESPRVPWPANAGEHTAFSVRYRAGRALNLHAPPFDDDPRWQHHTDYEACQELAEAARAAGVHVIVHPSVRDPEGGMNVAVLSCAALASREPEERQSWKLYLGSGGVRAVCDSPETRLAFDREAFAADPRMASLQWERLGG